jgi:hypothetical protein
MAKCQCGREHTDDMMLTVGQVEPLSHGAPLLAAPRFVGFSFKHGEDVLRTRRGAAIDLNCKRLSSQVLSGPLECLKRTGYDLTASAALAAEIFLYSFRASLLKIWSGRGRCLETRQCYAH